MEESAPALVLVLEAPTVEAVEAVGVAAGGRNMDERRRCGSSPISTLDAAANFGAELVVCIVLKPAGARSLAFCPL